MLPVNINRDPNQQKLKRSLFVLHALRIWLDTAKFHNILDMTSFLFRMLFHKLYQIQKDNY